MATFRVGQRVKRVGDPMPGDPVGYASNTCMPLGATGIVTRLSTETTWVRNDVTNKEWPCFHHTLAPLTDPKADAFIESIKQMKPYSEPTIREFPAKVKA